MGPEGGEGVLGEEGGLPYSLPWTLPGPGGAAGAVPRGSSPPLGVLGPCWPAAEGQSGRPVSGDRADGGAGGAGQEGVERAAPAGAAAGAAGSAAHSLRPAAQGTVAPGRDPPSLSLPPSRSTRWLSFSLP